MVQIGGRRSLWRLGWPMLWLFEDQKPRQKDKDINHEAHEGRKRGKKRINFVTFVLFVVKNEFKFGQIP